MLIHISRSHYTFVYVLLLSFPAFPSRISPLHRDCFHFHFKESHFKFCALRIPLHSFNFQFSPFLIPQVLQMLHWRFPFHRRGAKFLHPSAKFQTTSTSFHPSVQLPTKAFKVATLGNQIIIFSSSNYKIIT